MIDVHDHIGSFSWLDLSSSIFHVIMFLILSNKEIKEEENTLLVKIHDYFKKS